MIADLGCRPNMQRVNKPSQQATYAAPQTRMLSAKFVLTSQTVHYLRTRYLAHASQALPMNPTIVASLPIWSISALTALQVRLMPPTLAVSSPTPRIVATMSSCPYLQLHLCSLSSPRLRPLRLQLLRGPHLQQLLRPVGKEKDSQVVQLLALSSGLCLVCLSSLRS
jgi:hypothetical protein